MGTIRVLKHLSAILATINNVQVFMFSGLKSNIAGVIIGHRDGPSFVDVTFSRYGQVCQLPSGTKLNKTSCNFILKNNQHSSEIVPSYVVYNTSVQKVTFRT